MNHPQLIPPLSPLIPQIPQIMPTAPPPKNNKNTNKQEALSKHPELFGFSSLLHVERGSITSTWEPAIKTNFSI